MTVVEWTEVLPGEEYRTQIDGVTYGVRWHGSLNHWQWTTRGGGLPAMNNGGFASAKDAMKTAESYARKSTTGP